MSLLEKLRLDELDLAILEEIQKDSRISNNELARRIHLSQPAAHARLKRLKSQGIIREYVAILDNEKLGLELSCFFLTRLQAHAENKVKRFEVAVRLFPEVLECHYVTGEYDYLIKAVFKNRRELEQFMRQKLSSLPNVAQIITSVVLSVIKSTTKLPLL